MMTGSVAVVDMVGYSDVANVLEQNISAGSVAELNRQIQGLVNDALADLPETADYCFVARTGDGAILFFNEIDDAHFFARSLHLRSKQHNEFRTEASAKRWFRIGIATGPVSRSSCHGRNDEYAGITIANAVRLEASAKVGEIVMDAKAFAELSSELRPLYGEEERVRGKRAERFTVRRFRVVVPDVQPLEKSTSLLSRRRFVGIATSAAGLAAGSYAFIKYPEWRYPLPDKRFVALIAWPRAINKAQIAVASVLQTINDQLVRSEASVPKLLIIPETDLAAISPDAERARATKSPAEIASLLGATLILTAQSIIDGTQMTIVLQVLDAAATNVLRHQRLSGNINDLPALSKRASHKAASMLQLPIKETPVSDEDEMKRVPPEAYQAYIQARLYYEAPNDSGLDMAIAAYEDALKIASHFAAAYAGLALTYIRKYQQFSDQGALDVASNNAARAFNLNPDSLSAILAKAELETYHGNTTDALATISSGLAKDPSNPDLLLYKALVYDELGKPADEEAVYRQLIRERPSHWVAYNELGGLLKTQADYDGAQRNFEQAAELAPAASMPVSNLGMMYLEQGDEDQAAANFNKALNRSPDTEAYSGLGNIAFAHANYSEALNSYKKASALDPSDDISFRNIADCYAMLSKPEEVKKNYARAADLLYKKVKLNSKSGQIWARLAFYDAKAGNTDRALTDIARANDLKANDVDSDFKKAQAYAVLGRKQEALGLLIKCVQAGLSPINVGFALDLKEITSDPRYKALVAKQSGKS